MKPHTKIYLDFFGFTEGDNVPCEVCARPAVDIHHIKARGMGGSSTRDEILNLQAVCRECHIKYGDKKQHVDMLRIRHVEYMAEMEPKKTEFLLNQIYSKTL